MFLIAAVGFLLAAGPGPWASSGPAYPSIDLIAIAPDEENVVYAGAHDPASGKSALFRSRDGGTSWETVAEAPAGETLQKFAIDPTAPERMLALTGSVDGHGRLYRSDDGGRSWRQEPVAFNPEGSEIFFDPVASNTAFIFFGRLRLSEDSGPWTNIESELPMDSAWLSPLGRLYWSAFVQPTGPDRHPWFPPPPPHWETFFSATKGRTSSSVGYSSCPDLDSVVYAPSDSQVAYAVSTTCGPLATSMDGGENWTYVASADLTNLFATLLGEQVEKIAVNPEDASSLFITVLSKRETSGLLLHSENRGRTWTSIAVPADPNGPLAISPSGRFLYLGTEAGVYRLSLTGTRVLAPRD